MTYDPARASLVHAPADRNVWSVVYERPVEDDAASYRDVSLYNVPCVFGVGDPPDVTIAIADIDGIDGIYIAVGDVIVDDATGREFRVLAVNAPGSYFILTLDASGGTGTTCTWHQSIATTVQWQAQTMPGQSMRWLEWQAHFQDVVAAYGGSPSLTFGGSSDTPLFNNPSYPPSVSVLIATNTSGNESTTVRVGPPRDLIRVTELYPSISITAAGMLWRLTEFDLLMTAPQAQLIGTSR